MRQTGRAVGFTSVLWPRRYAWFPLWAKRWGTSRRMGRRETRIRRICPALIRDNPPNPRSSASQWLLSVPIAPVPMAGDLFLDHGPAVGLDLAVLAKPKPARGQKVNGGKRDDS